jgi:hypothetical protein
MARILLLLLLLRGGVLLLFIVLHPVHGILGMAFAMSE